MATGLTAVLALAAMVVTARPALAACAPTAPVNNTNVECASTTFGQNGISGYGTGVESNLNVTVTSGASVAGTSYGFNLGANDIVNNSGAIGLNISSSAIIAGNGLSVNNSGTIFALADGIAVSGTVNVTNSGSISQSGGHGDAIFGLMSANVTNSGTISSPTGGDGIVGLIGGVTLSNSGTISAPLGTAVTSNGGPINVVNTGTVSGGSGIASLLGYIGNAAVNVTNSGTIVGSEGGIAVSGGYTSVNNSGVISAGVDGIFGWSNVSAVNSGTIAGGDYAIYAHAGGLITNSGNITGATAIFGGSGSLSLINSGTIVGTGGTAIDLSQASHDSLVFLSGSKIIGAILLGTGDSISINAGNQNLTFNSLAGATVTGSVPYVVTGNTIASVDPTPFGIADKNLMAFTGAVWGLLGSRGDTAASDGDSGPMGFAADTPSYVEDAFAQVMGYAKAPSDIAFFKNPTMTTADGTTIWAKGFYGQRTQEADGPNLRNVTQFYGGAIGLDRMVSPDLRLGGFAGAGSTSTVIDLNFGVVRSDIGFGGVYGRKDIGTVFVDFALLGGATSNQTTRNINDNLLANGSETATGSFGGWFVSPELAVGKRYAIDTIWSLTPTARLRYLAAGLDGYTETGSTANLTVGNRTLQNIEERGDLTLTQTQTFANADRLSVSIYSGLLGQQRVGNSGINAILLGQALAFATPGKSSIGGAYAGVGVEWLTGKHITMFASAEYAAMTDASNTVMGRAGLRYGF